MADANRLLATWIARAPNAYLRGGRVPVFSPRHEAERQADPYDRDAQVVDLYTAIAYGGQGGVWDLAEPQWGRGGQEGLYRAVASYVLELGCSQSSGLLLDVGCGVGRTARDCGAAMPGWWFVETDFSYRMCERADEALSETEPLALATLGRKGFLTATVPTRETVPNAIVCQCSALDLPFHAGTFDCVAATLLLDRLPDPIQGLREIARVLKMGGRAVLSSPLNFGDAGTWISLGNRDAWKEATASAGLRATVAYDGLIYREVKDRRGNYEDWQVAVLVCDRESPR